MKAEVVRLAGRDPRDNPRFVVTNPPQSPRRVYPIYRERGDVENRLTELHYGLGSDRTSCTDFWANAFRVLLTAAAYVLLQPLRQRMTATPAATLAAVQARGPRPGLGEADCPPPSQRLPLARPLADRRTRPGGAGRIASSAVFLSPVARSEGHVSLAPTAQRLRPLSSRLPGGSDHHCKPSARARRPGAPEKMRQPTIARPFTNNAG